MRWGLVHFDGVAAPTGGGERGRVLGERVPLARVQRAEALRLHATDELTKEVGGHPVVSCSRVPVGEPTERAAHLWVVRPEGGAQDLVSCLERTHRVGLPALRQFGVGQCAEQRGPVLCHVVRETELAQCCAVQRLRPLGTTGFHLALTLQ